MKRTLFAIIAFTLCITPAFAQKTAPAAKKLPNLTLCQSGDADCLVRILKAVRQNREKTGVALGKAVTALDAADAANQMSAAALGEADKANQASEATAREVAKAMYFAKTASLTAHTANQTAALANATAAMSNAKATFADVEARKASKTASVSSGNSKAALVVAIVSGVVATVLAGSMVGLAADGRFNYPVGMANK